MKATKILFSFLILFALTVQFGTAQITSEKYVKLAEWMEGSYSSEEQSKNDSDFYDIRLHMKSIWKERSDGLWFYVEQAVGTKQEKPYRQRIYCLIQLDNDNFESRVYTFNNPLHFAGEWKLENPLSSLSPDSLVLRKGCSVFMKYIDDNLFEGSTKSSDCESDLRGAKYATSEVKIYKDKLISWDRGFNEKDEQVWGATKGGYIFIKTSNK